MRALENAIISNCDIMIRSIDPVKFTLPGNPFSGDIIQTQRVPGVQVQMPVEDWNEIMEIYYSHYRPLQENPTVKDAWQQYRMALALTRKT